MRAWQIVFVMTSLFGAVRAAAQPPQVHIETPLYGYSESYYESFGVGWGIHRWGPRGGFFFDFPGGPPPVAFGGGGHSAGARFGFGGPWGGLRLFAAQGSSRTMTMTAPSITTMSPGGGYIFSGTVRPFVYGLIPVVGTPLVAPPWAPPPMEPLPPMWSESAVREMVERSRLQRLQRERAEDEQARRINAGRTPTRRNDDPPLILGK